MKNKGFNRLAQCDQLFKLLHTAGGLDRGSSFLRNAQECIDLASKLMEDSEDFSESSFGSYVRELIVQDLKSKGVIKPSKGPANADK